MVSCAASIESIIAISFILGFYHDDARKLLGSFKSRITRETTEAEKQKGARPESREEDGASIIRLTPEETRMLKKILQIQGEGEEQGKTVSE